jgi:hypothetical protein
MKSEQCFADFFEKNRWRIFLFSIGSGYYRYQEKSRKRCTRYRAFLQRKFHDSIRKHTELFSRWGPLKKSKKFAEM